MTKAISVKIESASDRMKMIEALANNGYKVWVEERNKLQYSLTCGDFYVCFEMKGETK